MFKLKMRFVFYSDAMLLGKSSSVRCLSIRSDARRLILILIPSVTNTD